LIILAALIADCALGALAEALNLRAAGGEVPAELRDVLSPQGRRLARDYLRARTRLEWAAAAALLAATLAVWLAGGFQALDESVRAAGLGPVPTGLLFVAAVALGRALLALPFQAYAVFGVEERFGFNRTRPATFVADRLKMVFVAAALGGPVLAGVLALFEYAGPHAWLYGWVLAALCLAAMQVVLPRWVLPLFNRFTPLPDGELRRAIFGYARAVGFPLDNVFVIDGSRRSTKRNAFFTGFGRHRRIVLFDTLVKAHTVPELIAVLAHEMGHDRRRHVLKNLAISLLHTGAMLGALSFVLRRPALFEAFFVAQPSVYAGLVLFAVAVKPLETAFGVLLNRVSRAHELEADRFAAETTGAPEALASALKKLHADNLANLTPHPLAVALGCTHPPLAARLRALQPRRPKEQTRSRETT
jgi:STE24 endopeptidase